MAGTFFLSLRPRKLPLRLAVHHRSLEPSADPAAALEPCPALRASQAGGAAPPLPVQLLRRWPSGPVLTAVCALRRCCAVGWPAGRGRGPSLPSVSSSIKFPWLPCHVREQEEGKEEDDANYRIATGSFNLRRFFVLNPFQFVPVALVSCRRDLRSRVISFYITCL